MDLFWQNTALTPPVPAADPDRHVRTSRSIATCCADRLGRHHLRGARLRLLYAGIDQGNRLDWLNFRHG
jgi:hypothetical protein